MLSVVASLPSGAMSWLAADALNDGATRFESVNLAVRLEWLWLGFVVVALAEVFRVGVDLRDDNELTI